MGWGRWGGLHWNGGTTTSRRSLSGTGARNYGVRVSGVIDPEVKSQRGGEGMGVGFRRQMSVVDFTQTGNCEIKLGRDKRRSYGESAEVDSLKQPESRTSAEDGRDTSEGRGGSS